MNSTNEWSLAAHFLFILSVQIKYDDDASDLEEIFKLGLPIVLVLQNHFTST